MIIYCDLDGVLVDLHRKLSDLYGFKLSNGPDFADYFYNIVDRMTSDERIDFWQNLPATKDCHDLWNYIKVYKPKILTSCSDSKEACEGKGLWCEKHLSLTKDQIICASKSKVKKYFATRNAILIDDLLQNIDEWVSWGGTAILHKNADDTIKQLKLLSSCY